MGEAKQIQKGGKTNPRVGEKKPPLTPPEINPILD